MGVDARPAAWESSLRAASALEAPEEPLDTSIAIETPEHIQFRYQVAGPSRRALAYALDFALRALIGL